jgi:hypothetical protein
MKLPLFLYLSGNDHRGEYYHGRGFLQGLYAIFASVRGDPGQDFLGLWWALDGAEAARQVQAP